ncbi:hypothetical protein WEI85_39220, partial [Actinomycetes bacterium KLBMP 9797]
GCSRIDAVRAAGQTPSTRSRAGASPQRRGHRWFRNAGRRDIPDIAVTRCRHDVAPRCGDVPVGQALRGQPGDPRAPAPARDPWCAAPLAVNSPRAVPPTVPCEPVKDIERVPPTVPCEPVEDIERAVPSFSA